MADIRRMEEETQRELDEVHLVFWYFIESLRSCKIKVQSLGIFREGLEISD